MKHMSNVTKSKIAIVLGINGLMFLLHMLDYASGRNDVSDRIQEQINSNGIKIMGADNEEYHFVSGVGFVSESASAAEHQADLEEAEDD